MYARYTKKSKVNEMKKLRCSICDKIIPETKAMKIVYDKDIDIMVCKIHKEVKGDDK
jgi:ribosomal protein S26